MADFKFSCPHCEQHIAANDAWSGREIVCPTCQATIMVPASERSTPPMGIPLAPTTPPVLTSSASPRSSLVPPRTSSPRKQTGAWSGLAIASFVTGICCVHLAAIICGHLALGRFKRESQLKGKWMAVVGLLLGYLSLTVSVAAAGLILFGALQARQQGAQFPRGDTLFPNRPGRNTMPTAPADGGLGDTSRGVSASDIAGTIQGQSFRVESVEIRGDRVELNIATEAGKKDQITLFLFLEANPALENLSLKVPSSDRRTAPHVHVPKLAEFGRTILSSDYTLDLEFESHTADGLPGSIRFSAQKPFLVEFSGKFVAMVR